jgi:type III secretion protein L
LVLKEKGKRAPIVMAQRVLRREEFLAASGSEELLREGEKRGVEALRESAEIAKKVVRDANGEAKKIIAMAVAAKEEERKKGYEEGLAEGKKEMAARMADMAKKEIGNFLVFEDSLLNIVVRAMRRIVGELGDEERARRLVSGALSVVRNQRRVTVRVHPDDADAARLAVKDAAAAASAGDFEQFVEVVADGRLDKNSCVMETELGTIDASLDTQLDAIRRLLGATFSGD